jgi:hypothetical protein
MIKDQLRELRVRLEQMEQIALAISTEYWPDAFDAVLESWEPWSGGHHIWTKPQPEPIAVYPGSLAASSDFARVVRREGRSPADRPGQALIRPSLVP